MRKLPRSAVSIAGIAAMGWAALHLGLFDQFSHTFDAWGRTPSRADSAYSGEPGTISADKGPRIGPAAYRLSVIERRPMIEKVSATGTLNPVALVSVSSQVSGQIKEIYVDYNQEVKKGDPIALIDPVTFEIAVDQAQAQLDIAEASVATQKAMIDRMAADLDSVRFDQSAARANTEYAAVKVGDALGDLKRKQSLGANGPKADLQHAEAAFHGAEAQLRSAQAIEAGKASNIQSAEAQLRSAQAQLLNLEAGVRQQQAALRQAKIELERTVIRAPVDGTVTIRNIEIGTTVAVSLQAPVLFTMAQNLREMQVNASVTEAEIGRILVGQKLEFTVDAYPGRAFIGYVQQIRMHPQTTQNVVNYTVIASAPNPDLLLMPGMTATANLIINETEPELTVASAALRFRPPGDSRSGEPRLYLYENGEAVPVVVELGPTDAGFTAIRGKGIDESSQVILGLADQGRQESASRGGGILGLF